MLYIETSSFLFQRAQENILSLYLCLFFSYALVLEYLKCSSNIYFGECGCTGVVGWLRVKSICCNNFHIVFILWLSV